MWPPYRGTGTADQADLAKLGSAQLNLMSLHSTLVWQLPIIEHKIDRHGGRSWKRQRPLVKPHDDDDDDDEQTVRVTMQNADPFESPTLYGDGVHLQGRTKLDWAACEMMESPVGTATYELRSPSTSCVSSFDRRGQFLQ